MATNDRNVQPIESEGEENEIEEVGKDGNNIWTNERENLFITIMEEEVIKGNRVTTTFSRESWKFIRETMSKKTKYNYSDSQLRNKFNQLRARYSNFKKLLAETGIGYVSATGQVIASEQVWQRLYLVHKMAKRFQKKGCPLYEKLCLIFGDTSATGANARPSTRSPSNTDENTPIHDIDKEFEDEVDDLGDSNNRKRSASGNTNKSHGKKPNVGSAMQSALNSISECSKKKVDLWEKLLNSPAFSAQSGAPSMENISLVHSPAPKNNLDESMDELNKLDGIDEAAYVRAVERFHDPTWRDLFLRMPESKKKYWVLSLK